MDLDLLSKILRELILANSRVSLPGMGSFIAEKAPSVFSDRAMVIHPPFRRILFRPSEIWNDELLETKYAQEQGYKIEVAKHDIAEFVNRLKVDLSTNKTYRIPKFGTMRATEQNDYFFVADKDLFNYVETFGLEPVNIKFLPRRGEVESLNGKPIYNFFKKDIRSILNSDNTFTKEELVIQEGSNTQEEPVVNAGEPIVNAGEQIANKEEPVVNAGEPIVNAGEQIANKEEPVVNAGEPIANKEPIVNVQDPIVNKEPIINKKPVVNAVEPIVSKESIVNAEEPIVNAEEPVAPVEAPAPIKAPPIPLVEPVPLDKPTSSKFIRKVLIILGAIFFIILVITLLFVFKEELRPFWEWILYSKEEREILRSSISSLK